MSNSKSRASRTETLQRRSPIFTYSAGERDRDTAGRVSSRRRSSSGRSSRFSRSSLNIFSKSARSSSSSRAARIFRAACSNPRATVPSGMADSSRAVASIHQKVRRIIFRISSVLFNLACLRSPQKSGDPRTGYPRSHRPRQKQRCQLLLPEERRTTPRRYPPPMLPGILCA